MRTSGHKGIQHVWIVFKSTLEWHDWSSITSSGWFINQGSLSLWPHYLLYWIVRIKQIIWIETAWFWLHCNFSSWLHLVIKVGAHDYCQPPETSGIFPPHGTSDSTIVEAVRNLLWGLLEFSLPPDSACSHIPKACVRLRLVDDTK